MLVKALRTPLRSLASLRAQCLTRIAVSASVASFSGALHSISHTLRCQFSGDELAALPDGLDEQTSLRELRIDCCSAAQQLVVSKLTALTVLMVWIVLTSSSACGAVILALTQQRTNGVLYLLLRLKIAICTKQSTSLVIVHCVDSIFTTTQG